VRRFDIDMRIPPPIIPKEHGAWAVLFVPLLVGASIAGKFTLNVLWLALGTLAVFMSYVPVQTLLRACLVSPQTPARGRAAKFWAAAYLIFGALFMLPLFLRGLWWLLGIVIQPGDVLLLQAPYHTIQGLRSRVTAHSHA